MKKDTEEILERRVGNKYLHYMLNRGLGDFVSVKKDQLKNSKLDKASLQELAKEIAQFLKEQQIPPHWAETVIRDITGAKHLLPDHECISIKVDDRYIYSKGIDKNQIDQMQGSEVGIVITQKTTQTQIVEFVKRHNDLIQALAKALKLERLASFSGQSYQEELLAELLQSTQKLTARELSEWFPTVGSKEDGYDAIKKLLRAGKKNRVKK